MINDLVGDYAFYYIEANAFCVLILLILYFKTSHSVDRQRRQMFFGNTLATAMFYLMTDMFWVLVDSGKINPTPFLLYLTNMVYYLAASCISYVVSYFMVLYEGNKKIEEPRVRFLTAVPFILNVAAIMTTPLHKMYIYVDGNGELVTAPLYPLLVLLIIIYPIVVAIRAIYLAVLAENYAKRNMYKAIGFFPVFPVGLGIMQVFHTRIPFLCFGLTIALLLIYIDFTDDLVSLDPLTKLNNRNELYRFMSAKMNSSKASGALGLYLMIMDIDSFKKINDTYGHNEGDRALKVLAKVLKRVCSHGPNRFVARFGGDEFIVVVETSDKHEVERISDEIHSFLDKAIIAEQLSFKMDVSIGWTRYIKNTDKGSIGGLIERADAMLYEEKKQNIAK
ncbi:diguanylate cyclase (GGDEF) domain-containing protein [Lachnospiraceae bacterium JC7]|nr:diguanylate cyclase (GGDEF) domain-containing protein [Lachnospiraceae bacterium JC7]